MTTASLLQYARTHKAALLINGCTSLLLGVATAWWLR